MRRDASFENFTAQKMIQNGQETLLKCFSKLCCNYIVIIKIRSVFEMFEMIKIQKSAVS